MAAVDHGTTTCDATKRNGEPCRAPAGRGTGHPGVGRCENHGGASPNGEKNGAALYMEKVGQAIDPQFADLEPADSMIRALRLTATRHWLASLRAQEAVGTDRELDWAKFEQGYLKDLVSVSAAATKLNLDRRMVMLAERQGDMLSAAFEAAVRILGDAVTVEMRRRMVEEYALAIMRMERQDFDVDGSVGELEP